MLSLCQRCDINVQMDDDDLRKSALYFCPVCLSHMVHGQSSSVDESKPTRPARKLYGATRAKEYGEPRSCSVLDRRIACLYAFYIAGMLGPPMASALLVGPRHVLEGFCQIPLSIVLIPVGTFLIVRLMRLTRIRYVVFTNGIALLNGSSQKFLYWRDITSVHFKLQKIGIVGHCLSLSVQASGRVEWIYPEMRNFVSLALAIQGSSLDYRRKPYWTKYNDGEVALFGSIGVSRAALQYDRFQIPWRAIVMIEITQKGSTYLLTIKPIYGHRAWHLDVTKIMDVCILIEIIREVNPDLIHDKAVRHANCPILCFNSTKGSDLL